MFAFLRKLFKKKNLFSKITFEIAPNADIFINCDLPNIKKLSEQEQLSLSQKFANLIINITNGNLNAIILHAIAVSGYQENQEKFTRTVLFFLDKNVPPEKKYKGPVISPMKVFE